MLMGTHNRAVHEHRFKIRVLRKLGKTFCQTTRRAQWAKR